MAGSWECPDCGRRFVNTNQWHACTTLTVDEHLSDKSDESAELYHAFEAAVQACGEFRVHAQKTRIAFINAMTFAGAKLTRRWIDVSFILPEPEGDPRIRSIEMYGPTSGHTIRIAAVEEFDKTVRAWLCAAHRRGLRETLDSDADVAPVVGRALDVLMIPLRARVVEHDADLAIEIPAYADAALGECRDVMAKVGGTQLPAKLVEGLDHGVVVLDQAETLRERDLGVGDPVDVFITADL